MAWRVFCGSERFWWLGEVLRREGRHRPALSFPQPCSHQKQNLRSKTRPPSQSALRLKVQGNYKTNKIEDTWLGKIFAAGVWLGEVFAAGGASLSGAVFPPSRAPTRNKTCVRNLILQKVFLSCFANDNSLTNPSTYSLH